MKYSLHTRGCSCSAIDPHDVVFQDDFVVCGKIVSKKTFVGMLTDHVKKLFPELVSD